MWYVIQTRPGHEEAIKEKALKLFPEGAHGECKVLYYVSKKRYLGEWHEERERFLPGYLFLVADDPKPAAEVSGRMAEFTRLLGYGKTFYPVREEEEAILRQLIGERDEIGMSYGVIENGALKIKDGVLAGMERLIRKIDRHKRKGYISLSLPGGEEKLVGVGLEITEKS
ncbi:MAG: antiterminator LoaP [Lachnospiraceae bacterium]|nr:antiterminator LoaP [Lachnospiraceae bacterium]